MLCENSRTQTYTGDNSQELSSAVINCLNKTALSSALETVYCVVHAWSTDERAANGNGRIDRRRSTSQLLQFSIDLQKIRSTMLRTSRRVIADSLSLWVLPDFFLSSRNKISTGQNCAYRPQFCFFAPLVSEQMVCFLGGDRTGSLYLGGFWRR